MTIPKTTNILVLTALFACTGESLDVGEDVLTSGTGGTGGSSTTGGSSATNDPLPDWTDFGACPTTGAEAPQFIGTWEGTVENFYLDPVVPIRLVITEATSDGVCGNLSWGTTTTTPLPLTDPAQSGAAYGFGGALNFPVSGLTYTLVHGTARGGMLRFEVPAHEHWREFCETQSETHYHAGAGRYACTEPYSALSFAQEEDGSLGDTCAISTSHGVVELPLKQCSCELACACNESACTAMPDLKTHFHLELTSGFGEDVLASGNAPGTVLAVRLVRVP